MVKIILTGVGPIFFAITLYLLDTINLVSLPGGEKSPIWSLFIFSWGLVYSITYFALYLKNKDLSLSLKYGVITAMILFSPLSIGIIWLIK